MKIRIEVDKTTVRLNKIEFQDLLNNHELSQESVYPDGNKLRVELNLATDQELTFNDNALKIVLPIKEVAEHTPNKVGLTFNFQKNNEIKHCLLFEVDIKRPPLNKARTNS